MSMGSTTSTPPPVTATPSCASGPGWRLTATFFLATKTGERTRALAFEEIERSLERLRTDHVDLIQLHNLVDPDEWETAFAGGGVIEAVIEAQAQGLVRYIGVTGHA